MGKVFARLIVLAILTTLVILLVASRVNAANYSRASYFGPGLYGNHTACGQTLTRYLRGVAHRWLPCGTRVRICRAGRCVSTHVVDRGPFVYSRDLDLTRMTARRLCGCRARYWGVRTVRWWVVR